MSEIEHFLILMRNKDPKLFEIYQSATRGLEWVWQFRNRDMGWGPTPQASSSLETTFWVVKNLLPITAKEYFQGTKEFVLNLKNPDGYWGDTAGAKSTYRHTSCAINIMNLMSSDSFTPPEQELIEVSKKWLVEGCDQNGGWGIGPQDPHDMHNTYIVCSTMLDLGLKVDEQVIKRTFKWLKDTQMANGAWPLNADRGGEVDIENSAKAFLLMRSLGAEDKTDLDRICGFMLKNQNDDGGWGNRPGLESDISPSGYAFKCLTDTGHSYTTHPEEITKLIEYILNQQDRVGFWAREGSDLGSVGLTSFIVNSLFSQIHQTILSVPLSTILQLHLPTLTGRTIASRRIKSPTREMAQIIYQLEGEEHYDIFLDRPETENILFTHSRHFVPKEVRRDIFQRAQEINDMFNILEKGGDWSRTGAEESIYEDLNDKMNRLGKGLYFDFVPASLQKILSTMTSRYLMIATNDPLIPWELIYLPEKDTYLGLEFALGRKVLMIADRLPRVRKSYDNILHVLLVGNPSCDLPSSENEVKYISEKLESLPQVETKLLVGEDVTRTNFEKVLSEQHYDIVHYAGHSFYNPQNPDKSYLELANGEAIYASQFSWLFQKGVPSVIFLNACSTARDTSEEEVQHERQITGMIRQLMNIGVQSVIGSIWSMHDIISATIASEFYRNLTHNMTLGESLQSARKIVHNSFKHRNVGWNGFILYGNPLLKLD
ncbi:MAG: CHAT domain-containing protein [Thermoplasmata archaeon]|nr:MAG: CHAT domain-containing protein [Thermoplasmata archaeon]